MFDSSSATTEINLTKLNWKQVLIVLYSPLCHIVFSIGIIFSLRTVSLLSLKLLWQNNLGLVVLVSIAQGWRPTSPKINRPEYHKGSSTGHYIPTKFETSGAKYSLRLVWLLVCCLYKEVYLQIFTCVSFWLHGCCGEWEGGPVNQVNHTSWVAVVTPTDRPKSVRNRCLIEPFCGVVCVVTLPFWHFCWCRGFCHRTGSDLLLLSWVLCCTR